MTKTAAFQVPSTFPKDFVMGLSTLVTVTDFTLYAFNQPKTHIPV